jgi:predicted deacylase
MPAQRDKLHFHCSTFRSPNPGPALIVVGAVHGNETCGTKAIHRVVAAFNDGSLALTRGQVTFVPIANPLAFQLGQRSGDRNLNRKLMPCNDPQEFEDHVANWLCPLLAQHDVLLDLHSFNGSGQAFVMVGPEDNDGPVEAFRHAQEEVALAQILGVGRAVDGWLTTYARGVSRRRAVPRADSEAAAPVRHDVNYGVGTTEYMRMQGGFCVTLECGQHDDPQAPSVGYQAILNTLAHLQLVDLPPPAPMRGMEGLRIYDVIDKEHADDLFCQGWSSFDRLKKGQLIGTRHSGEAVTAPEDGYMLFPDTRAQAGEEWFYLAKFNDRFA